jgi:hypothetical protein
MSHSVNDYLSAMQEQNTWLEQEKNRLASIRATHQKQVAHYNQIFDQAWVSLAARAVPSLEPGVLDGIAGRLHLPSVNGAAAANAATELETFIKGKLEALARELPPHEVEGRKNEIEIRLDELDRVTSPLAGPIHSVRGEPHFHEIINSGYGTETYDTPWWRMSFYRHWKYADLIIEKYGDEWRVDAFPAFREKYLKNSEALKTLVTEKDDLVHKLRRLENVAVERKRWEEKLADTSDTVLGQMRDRVREHLEILPVEDLHALLSSDPALSLMAKRLDGARAKRRYLTAYFDRYLAPMEKDINKTLSKNSRHLQKYRRPKHRGTVWSDAEFNRRFADRRGKWNDRFSRYERARDRMWDFDDWDDYDPRDAKPWFFYFDDGSMKGRFLPEVAEYQSHRARGDHAAAAADRALDLANDQDDMMDWS